jgi:hypothetical protein
VKRFGLACVVALALAPACSGWAGPSRVREGALYRTGDSQYDVYFKDVHDVQVAVAGWNDDKKSARKPIVDALQLTADSSDSTIAQLVHEQVEAAQSSLGTAELKVNGDDVKFVTATGSRGSVDALATALEATAKGELARAKKLKDLPSKVDGLLKTGHDLEPHAREDFAKVGGQKPFEVKAELTASFSVLDAIESNAKREVRAAESFVADLQRAVALGVAGPDGGAPSTQSTQSPKATPPSTPRPPPPKPPPPSTGPGPVATPKPPPPTPPPATATEPPPPKPPPAPKPTSTGEVFNP